VLSSEGRRRRWMLGIPTQLIKDITKSDGLCASRALLQALVCCKMPGNSFAPDISLDNGTSAPQLVHQRAREFWNVYMSVLEATFPHLQHKFSKYKVMVTKLYSQSFKVLDTRDWLTNGEMRDTVNSMSDTICLL
jgi:hypothetical protein